VKKTAQSIKSFAILIKPWNGLAGSHGSGGKPEEAVIEDLEVLQNNRRSSAQSTRPPALLNRDDDFIQRASGYVRIRR